MSYIKLQFVNSLNSDFKNLSSHLSPNLMLPSSLEEIVLMKINSLILFFQKHGDDFANSNYGIKNHKIKSYQQCKIYYHLNHHATAGIRKAIRMKVYD